jgi:hypothetical protein
MSAEREAGEPPRDSCNIPAEGRKGTAMYGLPPDFDQHVFVGHSLEEICFNQNQIALRFDGNISLVIESAFCHQLTEESDAAIIDVPVAHSNILELLGHSVTDAAVVGQRTLVLIFDNGHRISVFDNLPDYEAFRIVLPDKESIV